jgi:ribosomal protein L20A (L18A)
MKVYSVIADKWDYDMYDEFVVVAKDEESALEMVIGSFHELQRSSVHVEEVDLTTEHMVLGSFNAG